MAFDILSIPAMSAEVERAFSQAKHLLTPCRNCLCEPIINACECLKQWQHIGIIAPPAGLAQVPGLDKQLEKLSVAEGGDDIDDPYEISE